MPKPISTTKTSATPCFSSDWVHSSFLSKARGIFFKTVVDKALPDEGYDRLTSLLRVLWRIYRCERAQRFPSVTAHFTWTISITSSALCHPATPTLLPAQQQPKLKYISWACLPFNRENNTRAFSLFTLLTQHWDYLVPGQASRAEHCLANTP